MSNTNMNDILKLLVELPDQDLANLIYGLQNVKAIRTTHNQVPETEVTDELPCINIPPEYLLPALEYLFMIFLRELGNNFKEDYKTKIFNTLTNNNSLIVTSYFDKTMTSEGQYPRAVVKCDQLTYSPEFIGNVPDAAYSQFSSTTFGNNEGASMQCSFHIDVIDQTYPATNMLGSIIVHNLAANLSTLRDVFSLQHISYPTLTGAQRIREFGDLYMASIHFTCKKQVRWYDKYTIKEYTNIVRRLTAYASGERTPEYIQYLISLGIDPDSVGEGLYAQIIQLSACRGIPLPEAVLNSLKNR